MDTAQSTIKTLSAGRILDVATGSGQFINFLIENLKNYSEIIGIDTSDKACAFFTEAYKDTPRIRFLQMDAERMDFPEASFDTVCISNSLHHMADLKSVLDEMKRVLRPGGNFIIAEMYCDNQTETQMTHVLLHHWLAAVDNTQGITHHPTYSRQQVLDIIAGLGLHKLVIEELRDLNNDPKDPGMVKDLLKTVDQYLKRIEGWSGKSNLCERGLELRKRIAEIGFHSATSLLAIGEKH
jgi:ubiquinone/menaquinone biosynthesis C-methylase UbiE